jgi:hypothetical protein
MSSLYYEPEKAGLETVGEIDTAGSYEFNTAWVSREKSTGKVYVAFDSGCSCPTPFEDHSFPDSFTHVESAASLRAELESWSDKQYSQKASHEDISRLVRQAFPEVQP